MKYEKRIAALQSVLRNEGNMRAHFSTELLDEIGSLLSVINYNLHMLEQNQRVDESVLKKMHGLIAVAIAETRKLSHDIMPHTLTHLGLSAALAELFDEVRSTGIRINAYINHFSSVAKGYEATILYRLFESMLRFLRHNRGCTEITVECEQLTDRTIFCLHGNGLVVYEDDFDKDLNLIRCYTAILNGSVDYEWYGEDRARIIVTLPADIV